MAGQLAAGEVRAQLGPGERGHHVDRRRAGVAHRRQREVDEAVFPGERRQCCIIRDPDGLERGPAPRDDHAQHPPLHPHPLLDPSPSSQYV